MLQAYSTPLSSIMLQKRESQVASVALWVDGTGRNRLDWSTRMTKTASLTGKGGAHNKSLCCELDKAKATEVPCIQSFCFASDLHCQLEALISISKLSLLPHWRTACCE